MRSIHIRIGHDNDLIVAQLCNIEVIAVAFGKTAAKGVDHGFNLSVGQNLVDTGLFHVQDLASQLCCMAVDPQKGELVADVCAAPGGKSFTLAERMGEGVVCAFDLHDHRVKLMEQGAARLGLTGVKAAVRDANAPDQTGILADRVLCDVPCSGLGVIGRKPETVSYTHLDYIVVNDDLDDAARDVLAILSAEKARAVHMTQFVQEVLNDAENGNC